MRYSNLQAFEKHLSSAAPLHLASLYLLIIEDRFQRKAIAQRLSKVLQSSQSETLTFDEENVDFHAVVGELKSLSLFARRKIIWLDLGEKNSTAFLKSLLSALTQLPPDVYFIISLASLAQNTSFFKQAEKSGVILEISDEKKSWEKEKNALEWVQGYVAQNGKRISADVCQYFVKHVGSTPGLLQNELDKLFCYVNDRSQLTLQDVQEICVATSSESAWQLGDALFQRDAYNAIRITKALLDSGTAFFALLRQIRHQVQTMACISSIITQKKNTEEITRLFPYMKGGLLDRNIRTAQSCGFGYLEKALSAIDYTETLAKNSSLEHNFLAELLIFKVTQP